LINLLGQETVKMSETKKDKGTGVEKTLIALIDRNTAFRLGVRSLLADEGNVEVIGEAGSADEGLPLIEGSLPNIALMDTSLARIFDLTWQINRRFPATSIIFVAEEEDDEEIFKGLKYGVVAYVTRCIEGEGLVNVIKRVSQGRFPIIEKLFNPGVASLILREFGALAVERKQGIVQAPLSFKEAEIVDQIKKGNSAEQIASTLKSNEQDINGELISIRGKLVANELTRDVTLALRYGLSYHHLLKEIDRVGGNW